MGPAHPPSRRAKQSKEKEREKRERERGAFTGWGDGMGMPCPSRVAGTQKRSEALGGVRGVFEGFIIYGSDFACKAKDENLELTAYRGFGFRVQG